MVLDARAPEISTGVDSDEEDVFSTNAGVSRGNAGTLHISRLLQMVLQDAQTWLFFKAQAVIQSEIRYYVPKTEDLAYPDKIIGKRLYLSSLGVPSTWCNPFTPLFPSIFSRKEADMSFFTLSAARTPMTGLREKEHESVCQLFGAQNQTSLASLERRDTWFPTLDTTARVLAQLHDFLQVGLKVSTSLVSAAFCAYTYGCIISFMYVRALHPDSTHP